MALVRKNLEPDVAQLPLLARSDSIESIEQVLRLTSAKSAFPTQAAEGIHIERLIEHEVDHLSGHVELADEVVSLSQHEGFFGGHIITGESKAEWGAYFTDPNTDVARWCWDLLGTEQEFIEASRNLAQRLYSVMTKRTISRGDFVAAVFTKGDNPTRYVALLKLDPDSRHVRNFHKTGNGTRVDISIANNILPESKNLAKCAILSPIVTALDGRETAHSMDIRLLDVQAGPRADGVAAFFFRGFLGTELVSTPRHQTRGFIHISEGWASRNSLDLTPAETEHFYAARRSALANDELDIEKFVVSALPGHPELHDDLSQELATSVVPVHDMDAKVVKAFTVDRVVAKQVTQEVIYELDGGARLSFPVQQLHEMVRIDRDYTPEHKTRIIIETQTFKEVSKR